MKRLIFIFNECILGVALFRSKVLKMFGLVHIIMPLHARKPYPKPWLQHTRGSDGERSPKIFSSEKKTESQTWGENTV